MSEWHNGMLDKFNIAWKMHIDHSSISDYLMNFVSCFWIVKLKKKIERSIGSEEKVWEKTQELKNYK